MEKIEVPELEDLNKKIREYVSKLPQEDQERVKKKAEKIAIKHYLRSGTTIKCFRCSKSGADSKTGPLMKMKDGSNNYIHKNCLIIGGWNVSETK